MAKRAKKFENTNKNSKHISISRSKKNINSDFKLKRKFNTRNNTKLNTRPRFNKNHTNSLNKKLKMKKNQRILEKKNSILKKEEDEILDIQNENDLFYGDRYIGGEDVNEDDWNTVSNTNVVNVNLSEMLFNKMNNVEEKKLDQRIIDTFSILGDILKTYTSGKLPKAFNVLPVTENWEEIIEITNPMDWSPQAMYEATKMFASNLNANLAESFYSKFLLPNIRADIKKFQKLNIHLYNCLKKAIFKPSGFFKGIIIPLSDSTTSKEASIIGSIIRKCSIPLIHSSACIMKLIMKCEDKLSMGALFFIKMLLLKKYALPTQVKDALVKFFNKYNSISISNTNKLPVLWHQTLLIFVQIYKLDLNEEEKSKLKSLINKHNHHLITEEIERELSYTLPQGNLLNSNMMKNLNMNMNMTTD